MLEAEVVSIDIGRGEAERMKQIEAIDDGDDKKCRTTTKSYKYLEHQQTIHNAVRSIYADNED